MKNSIIVAAVLGSSLCLLSFGLDPKSSEKNEVKSENQISVSATKMNILYVGLENPLDIAIPDQNSDNISVTIDNGTITKKSGVEWIANVYKQGKTTVQVFVEKDGQKILYGTKEFRAYPVPAPQPSISGSKGGPIDKQTMLQNPNLEVVMDNFLYDEKFFTIQSFTFRHFCKDKTKEVKCSTNRLSEEVLDLIKTANTGDVLTVEDIMVSDVSGTTRKIAGMTVKLR